jgi:hypothetical protein
MWEYHNVGIAEAPKPGSSSFHKLYIEEDESQINGSHSPFDQLNEIQ